MNVLELENTVSQDSAPVTHGTKWFYVFQGQPTGPVTEAELEALVRSGKIRPDTLVYNDVLAHWTPYAEAQYAFPVETQAAPTPVPSAATAAASPQGTKPAGSDTIREAVCNDCRGIFNSDAMLQHGEIWVCASCMHDYIDRMGLVTLIYADIGVRLVAKILDALIIAVGLVLPLAFWAHYKATHGDASWIVTLPFFSAAAYPLVYPFYAIFFVGRFGATPGKMLCKIRVTDPKGRKLSYWVAMKRYFAEVFGSMLWGLGYIMAAFDEQKRTLHDRICKTRVVSKITRPGPDILRFPAEA